MAVMASNGHSNGHGNGHGYGAIGGEATPQGVTQELVGRVFTTSTAFRWAVLLLFAVFVAGIVGGTINNSGGSISPPLVGDANGDGKVDGADIISVVNNFGHTVATQGGPTDGDDATVASTPVHAKNSKYVNGVEFLYL